MDGWMDNFIDVNSTYICPLIGGKTYKDMYILEKLRMARKMAILTNLQRHIMIFILAISKIFYLLIG
jgi:hypothetical protein